MKINVIGNSIVIDFMSSFKQYILKQFFMEFFILFTQEGLLTVKPCTYFLPTA